ncbi:MAG: CehA/McbA family metallohydrolase [Ginsengibacter sp.]
MQGKFALFLLCALYVHFPVSAQHQHAEDSHLAESDAQVESQPLLSQATRIQQALSFLGSSLSVQDIKKLEALQHKSPGAEVTKQIQQILDPYCIAIVQINPEARVKVKRGEAKATLIQGGWANFLIKVYNDAGVNAPLNVESPNALSPFHAPSGDPKVKPANVVTAGQSANRFLEMGLYRGSPLLPNLSGLKLEYAVVQIYSKDAGKREVEMGFNIGQGTQDIGFRNTTSFLFNIQPAVKVVFQIKDEDGSPSMASFIIRDNVERLPGRLQGTYPLPAKRVAAFDEYPDFSFQQHIYRQDGEHVLLPAGKYSVTITKGPEYIPQTIELIIPSGVKTCKLPVKLKRWIHLYSLGWYSADHHVHAGGCSHYDSPEEGVPPEYMWRQSLGEDLNVSAILAWGPSWYHQKTYFTGKDNPLSNKTNLIHSDVEVSGFPSSHAGHIVLLRLKEDDYPGTTRIEQWPSWTKPVLAWAKSQGGVTGYAHSGWGLEPVQQTRDLPNYVMPKMDGIGANEYIVTVTENLVDFYSLGDTPVDWELNMWYHTLNCGFRTRVSGETDFPCITDQRVGIGRSYFQSDSGVNYNSYVAALKKGRNYVSDGGSHILEFSVNGQEMGVDESEVNLKGKQSVAIKTTVAAYLPKLEGNATASDMKKTLPDNQYWNIERARKGNSRNVTAELIVNGIAVDSTEVLADGTVQNIRFSYNVDHSSWAAIRVRGSSHSNPIFILVDDKPIREKRSAQWCRDALDKCWQMKSPNIRPEERPAAKEAYDNARTVYEKMID